MTRSHRIATVCAVVLVVTALVLAALAWRAGGDDVERRIAIGESEPLRSALYGHEVVVRVPGAEVVVLVGDPAEHLDSPVFERSSGLYDPDAPVVVEADDDGLLVPVSTVARGTGDGLLQDDPGRPPVVARLVAGDRTVELVTYRLGSSSERSDAFRGAAQAVAVDGGLGLDDLRVEVEYDGVVQTAEVATGEVDAGVAQPLYDDAVVYATGCTSVPSRCALQSPESSRWRADDDSFTASDVSVYAYDGEHGWAAEGYRWASVRLQLFGAYDVVDATGRRRAVTAVEAPVVTLDGAEPAHADDLTGDRGDAYGRVVFQVADDAVPRELRLAQRVTLAGDQAPRTLDLSARVALQPPG
ncbi:hypothetical protein ABFT23_03055 [Nocardioides sp. C4-1]|uniref:hypothetical protein n=1 Tax=Nocardioides sp. C4-1 TaxID=3151851 RepID=UPI0032633499